MHECICLWIIDNTLGDSIKVNSGVCDHTGGSLVRFACDAKSWFREFAIPTIPRRPRIHTKPKFMTKQCHSQQHVRACVCVSKGIVVSVAVVAVVAVAVAAMCVSV